MSVYKEALYTAAELGKAQKQIFDDACDFGIPVQDEDKDRYLKLIQGLKEMYTPKSRKVTPFSLGATVTLDFEFMDEWNTGKIVPCRITYTRQSFRQTLHGPIVGIISIDCEWA
jgi:hypothetical protein